MAIIKWIGGAVSFLRVAGAWKCSLDSCMCLCVKDSSIYPQPYMEDSPARLFEEAVQIPFTATWSFLE